VHAINNTSYKKTLVEILYLFSKVGCSADIPLSKFPSNSFDVSVIHMTFLNICKHVIKSDFLQCLRAAIFLFGALR